MPLTNAGKTTAAEAVGDAYTWLALHNGQAGDAEMSGGGYARIQYSPGAGSAGVVAIPATGPFNVPSGASVSRFSIWSAQSGGTEGGNEALDTPTGVYAADGEFNFTGGTITATST